MNEQQKTSLEKNIARRNQVDKVLLKAAGEKQAIAAKAESVTGTLQQDAERVVGIINQAPAVLGDIHTQFEKATELKGKDIAFLFGAAAMQTARWALLPSMNFEFKKVSDRLTSIQGGKIETDGIKEYLHNSGYDDSTIRELMEHDRIRKYTWEKLLIAPVPYDAMKGSSRIAIAGIKPAGVELYGKNHHVATWGHDPVWGWIFGPLNITARMITFRDMQTFHVAQVGDTFTQQITYRASIEKMIVKAVNDWKDDSKKLFVSVAKQGLHLQSDKYTKLGLPIPFLSAELAQRLLLKGWNSNEIERLFSKVFKNSAIIGAQFGLALIFDNLVKALHLLCYDESTDGSISSYEVKTHKLICFSNSLAEIANGIYVATTRNFGKLDVGGYANFAKNLLEYKDLQERVEREFLEKELYKKLYGEEYYWEENE